MSTTDRHGDHAPKTASYTIVKRGDRIYAATPFSRTFVVEAKRLTGARWHRADKEWSWPAYQLQAVQSLCADLFGGSGEIRTGDARAQWAAPTGGWAAYDAAAAANAPNVVTSAIAPTISTNGDRMYGMSLDTVRQIFEGFPGRQAPTDKAVMAMGILSDAQEAMMSGDIEGARQMINRAKWGIARYFVVGGPGGNWEAAHAPVGLGQGIAPSVRQPIAVVRDHRENCAHCSSASNKPCPTHDPVETLASLPGTAPAVATGATMAELIEVERAAHLDNTQATWDALQNDRARGEMDRGSEPDDFDPELGF